MRNEAVLKYDIFVNSGVGEASPLTHTCHQLLLGDEAFVAAHQQSQYSGELIDTAKKQRRSVTLSLTEYQARYPDRDEAMARAYLSTAYTMLQIGLAFSVSTRTVSRALASFEKSIISKKAE